VARATNSLHRISASAAQTRVQEVPMFAALDSPPELSSGFSPGLRHVLDGVGNILIQDMRVSQRGLDVGMIEGLLHQLQVARFSQEFAGKVVPKS
jgi:hypothetical protein